LALPFERCDQCGCELRAFYPRDGGPGVIYHCACDFEDEDRMAFERDHSAGVLG
tara:strand:- start:3698 stop:3859 length:162 start_codon:yes stop_codon:yes gene_type:complete